MRVLSYFMCLFLLLACAKTPEEKPLTLWYDKPAGNWNEALPIGNGHAGAMVFGGVDSEQLQLNENTLYSGEPSVIFKDIKVTPEMFDKVVGLMRKERYKEATDLVCKNWLGRLHQYYQPFADLHIQNNKTGEVSEYKRDLNISDAIASTRYVQNGIRYEREVFASNPENVIVVCLRSDSPEGIDITLDFTSEHPTAVQKSKDDRLVVQGKAPGYVERRTFEQMESWGDQHKHPELYDEKGNRKFDKRVLYGDEIDNKGMLFEAQLKPVLPSGGNCEITDSGIHISQTDEVYFVMSLATSYNGYDKSPSLEGVDPAGKAAGILDKATAYNYKELKKRHLDDYRNLFSRVKLDLKSDEEQLALPTDERIIRFDEKADPALSALLFQYGRYLMISGSRPGGQPLNLQGIWNKEIVPPWNCGYTQNINLEMNYWMAETANLSECQEPLFTLIKELSETGAETARNMYGRRGWVAHHNTSLWRESLPNDNVPTASFWPMVQGWLCSHLWEHYLYSGDKEFLKNTAYPLTKGAAEFYADWLVDDGEGHLVTPVGVSPENWFVTPQGENTALSMGPTMDMAIIRETFERTIKMSEMFGLDPELRTELEGKLAKLLPYRIGSRGQLQEWMYDFKEQDPKHRHLSHLYGFYPGDQITPDATPDLFKAVEQSLNLRGDAATGWSMGWKINCWARLLDGNHAYAIIKNLFNPVQFGPKNRNGGGLYSNMLDACPPFQIDGNFGYTAGVAEMLLQSHAGFIQLLPALPDVWSEGAVSGLKARGNFEVAMKWQQGSLSEATILSGSGKECRLRTSLPIVVKQGGKAIATSSPVTSNGKEYYETVFATVAGKSYQVSPITP
ncbi:glycoside hydrolase family 95 protein [Parabacteroides sp. GYB001]|nr:glycoside hydrolase family 95 protein [Parabacteroides leei]MCL3850431.1 glycoside hydrolase family 95 protein [Parabacteroides leei]